MTADGDWDLSLGLQVCPDRATYVRQNLSVTFNFWAGEWFLDTREGIDYFGLVYGRKYDRGLLTALFRDAALATTGVGSVDSLELRFDNVARQLYVDFAGTTDTGDDVSGPFIVGVAQGVV
jgi:hypothetical protein